MIDRFVLFLGRSLSKYLLNLSYLARWWFGLKIDWPNDAHSLLLLIVALYFSFVVNFFNGILVILAELMQYQYFSFFSTIPFSISPNLENYQKIKFHFSSFLARKRYVKHNSTMIFFVICYFCLFFLHFLFHHSTTYMHTSQSSYI